MQKDLLDRLGRLPGGRRKARKTRKMISRVQNFAGYREYPKYLMMRHYWILKQAMLTEAAKLVDRGRRSGDLTTSTTSPSRSSARPSAPARWTTT